MTNLNFDASKVTPQQPLEPVPAGWYTVIIEKSDKSPTNDGAGVLLGLEMTVQEPVEYKGRKLWDRLNIENPNPTAVEIAFQRLSAICHAVGVIQVTDSSQLHGRPLQVKVSLVPAGPGNNGQYYDAKNDVKGYKAVGGATAAQATATAPIVPPAGNAVTPPPPAPAAQTAAPAVAPPPVPAAPPAPPVAPPPAVFPPADWLPHPGAAGYFYRGQECLTEAQLRAKIASEPPVTGNETQPAWAAASAPSPSPAPAPAPAPTPTPDKQVARPTSADVPPWAKPAP